MGSMAGHEASCSSPSGVKVRNTWCHNFIPSYILKA
jgi:hypothetical protein